jgi:hypothetical protein
VLDMARYLLGVVEIALLAGFAGLGASAVRRHLLPAFSGAPAHLATGVLALALLIWTAELLGTLELFAPLPYLLGTVVAGLALRWFLPAQAPAKAGGGPSRGVAAAGLAIALLAAVDFAAGTTGSLRSGMTGFDTTWYHGPFAAGFFQSGDTWDLHLIAPPFLAWFYPANAETLHAAGMLAFDRDVLSPLLNLGWLAGCLLALWCIGRPFRVELLSLTLGALMLMLPAFADQAGEARNDIVGAFFLLAAVAIAVNAWAGDGSGRSRPQFGALGACGLAAGLAAGTKLNFVIPAGVLVVGLALISGAAPRWRGLAVAGLAAVAGGGYWYLRNLVHSGNPLPWFDRVGPIPLPAPDQPLGGREGHSVLGYLADGSVWSDWLLPGLRDGLTVLWPLVLGLGFAGLVLCMGRRAAPVLRVAGAVGIAVAFAWLVAPTSASGPSGTPLGFESGLRYLVPALVLGAGLLPVSPPVRERLHRRLRGTLAERAPVDALDAQHRATPRSRPGVRRGRIALAVAILAAVALGYPVQRHYLANRYADPAFAAPGLNAAFRWAQTISGARIATTTTRQYPLFGADLKNDVRFVGVERPHGGFTAASSCRRWRRLLNAGGYDYVVASRDRLEPGKPAYPRSAAWTDGAGAVAILRQPPTVVFRLSGPLDPSGCP